MPLAGPAGPEPLERIRSWLTRLPSAGAERVRVGADFTGAGHEGRAGPLAGLWGSAPGGVLLFGRDGASWPALRLAARCGAAARTGVGDVLHLPDGRPARSNAELVAAARELLPREA